MLIYYIYAQPIQNVFKPQGTKMNRDIIRQFFNIVALVATLIVNYLSNALPLNGKTPAEISNSLPNLFVPANYVFSVWGVIYFFLIAFVVYQALPSQRQNPLLRRIGYLFVVSSIANISWIFLFHYDQYGLSVIAMLALLVTLITIYTRIGVGVTPVKAAARWWIHTPFSVYLGWITVATVANISFWLTSIQWNGFGIEDAAWAIIMLVVATLVAAAVIVTRRDIAYSAVILWALVGIYFNQQIQEPTVTTTALVMAAVVAVVLAARLFIGRSQNNAPAVPARADIPQLLNYQGYLTDAAGRDGEKGEQQQEARHGGGGAAIDRGRSSGHIFHPKPERPRPGGAGSRARPQPGTGGRYR
jgi:hypothetical protein